MTRLVYLIIIVLLSVLDSLLLTKPNFLGKIGLWIFKYSYLRTLPRAMVTVSMVTGGAILISELIVFVVRGRRMRKDVGAAVMLLFILACASVLAKIIMDFSKGVYSHTGIYFKIGVHLLPGILIFIFVTSLFRVLSKREQ